jgi:hypothetical protein
MSKRIYETFINHDDTTFYIGGAIWISVFHLMKKQMQVTMNTMVLERPQGTGLILKRTANIFDGELKILQPNYSTPADVIDAVMSSMQIVYEYHAVLNDTYKLDSIIPTCFTIRGKNVSQFIENNFRPGVIIELMELAKTQPEHILTTDNGKLVSVSKRISLDIGDYINNELSKEAELDIESGV